MTKKASFKLLILTAIFSLVALLRCVGAFAGLDQWVYYQALQLSESELWLQLWFIPTVVGSSAGLIPLSVLISLSLLYRKMSGRMFLFVALMWGLVEWNTVMKWLFHFERPVGFAAFYPEPTTFSFPSGHALNAVLLFYFFPRLSEVCGWLTIGLRKALLSPIICVAGITLIAMSRVLLGVHWFSDIVAGIIYGFLISEIGLEVFRRLEKKTCEI